MFLAPSHFNALLEREEILKTLIVSSFVSAGLFAGALAQAHGEDKPGPHQGFIKMPGAFHTELVALNESTVQVYLLDMNFKNPIIKDSKVEGKLRTKEGVEMIFSCTPEKTYFQCPLPEPLTKHPGGKILIHAERSGSKGIPAVYDLPLKR